MRQGAGDWEQVYNMYECVLAYIMVWFESHCDTGLSNGLVVSGCMKVCHTSNMYESSRRYAVSPGSMSK